MTTRWTQAGASARWPHLGRVCVSHTARERCPGHRAFSLIELVIVVVIIGVVAAIAIPRMSSAASRASDAAIQADIAAFQRAIDLYAAEHANRSPAHDADGNVNTDDGMFVSRLISKSSLEGDTGSGVFGPYLLAIPVNTFNNLDTVRIDGDPAGSDKMGWHFDSGSGVISPDDVRGYAIFVAQRPKAGGKTVTNPTDVVGSLQIGK